MPGMASETSPPEPTFAKSVAREYLESIVVAVLLALFVRTFAVQAFKIPTGSMKENLLVGDHLLVNKLVYSPSFGPLEDRILGKRSIARGHVVVFKYPKEPERDFIKRVIGLPGEKVEMRGRQVFVDDHLLDEPYTHFLPRPSMGGELPSGFESESEHWGPEVVPAGHLLVLGDNRNNSSDGRYWGFLPIDQVKGRALMVYWSYEARSDEYAPRGLVNWVIDFFSAFGRTRWERFFHLIK